MGKSEDKPAAVEITWLKTRTKKPFVKVAPADAIVTNKKVKTKEQTQIFRAGLTTIRFNFD